MAEFSKVILTNEIIIFTFVAGRYTAQSFPASFYLQAGDGEDNDSKEPEEYDEEDEEEDEEE